LANKYATGIGFHWYETWTKSQPLFENVEETAKAFPNKFLIFTEGCVEKFKFEEIYDWRLGEIFRGQSFWQRSAGLRRRLERSGSTARRARAGGSLLAELAPWQAPRAPLRRECSLSPLSPGQEIPTAVL
jgi:hypothetical protein